MTAAFRALLVGLLVALVAPVAASGHVTGKPQGRYQFGNAFAPAFTPAMKNLKESRFEKGPCTDGAAASMPVDEAHDHLDPAQHRFECRMKQVAFDDLTDDFKDNPERVIGEMDIKSAGGKTFAVIAIAFPHSGFLLYDVSDSAAPKLLSIYGDSPEEGAECEQIVIDVDCGAFVDLSPDLQRVYISEQQNTVIAGGFGTGTKPIAAIPGIETVSITDPKKPMTLGKITLAEDSGGVHTTRSFDVPEGPSSADKPREPGSYTVSVANGVGAAISEKTNGPGGLAPVETISMPELHDTFIQNDELTGRTLLYVAGGFDTGFYVYDITAPSKPKLLAEWDLTPECEQDWYSHTIDVATRNGRRYVTMPVELIDFFGDQDEADQKEGCGKFNGNGDLSGPLWIVGTDADFGNLSDGDDSKGNEDYTQAEIAALKGPSEKALTATWSNAANRAGGELTFSPHNQQIVGDRIYLSGYHSGVTVLDASAAFRGENVRPKEIAFHVPSGVTRKRPEESGQVLGPFFTSFLEYSPLVWDMQFTGGHVIAADMVGGVYSLKVDEDAPSSNGTATGSGPGSGAGSGAGSAPSPAAPPANGNAAKPAGCTDADRPASRFTRARLTRRGILLRGRSGDAGCSGVRRVQVAVGRTIGNKRCRFVRANGRLSSARRCSRPVYLSAKGTGSWSFRKRIRLARRSHLVFVRATDRAGNRERFTLRVNGKRVRVR